LSSAGTIIEHKGLTDKTVCLTLDVEQDFGELLKSPCYEGIDRIKEFVSFLKEKDLPLTCFVQGSLFDTHTDSIRLFEEIDTEFELHSYSHPGPSTMDSRMEIEKGIEAYNRFAGQYPAGYRSPLGAIQESDYAILSENHFQYDSSVFPTVRPGIFNNFSKPNRPFRKNGTQIIEFPITVLSESIRVPIALSYIKLFGCCYSTILKASRLPDLIIFDFHLHDLFRLKSADLLPLDEHSLMYRTIFNRIYRKNIDGLSLFGRFLQTLKGKGYRFRKLIDVYEDIQK